MEIITDTFDFVIKLVQHADLKISNVVYPDKSEPGKPIHISYDVTNQGGQDNCYGKIMDDATGYEIQGTRWQKTIGTGIVEKIECDIPPRVNDLHGKIVVGYIKEE